MKTLLMASAIAFATSVFAGAPAASVETEAVPGQVLRWPGSDKARCQSSRRSWAPIDGVCYFPIDLEQKQGVVSVRRRVAERSETARIKVGPRNYGIEEVELPDIPQAHPSPSDLKRDAGERAILGKVFGRKEGAPRFSLPLGHPAKPFPPGKAFGVDRVFNGKPAPQPHTGTDYPVPVGSPVLAAADGTVALAQDLFYPGNAVIIDHGDGLLTLYFHLADIKVEAGKEVKKGDRIGSIGSTGRSTGAHLFFGARWHNARVDPKFLLEDPKRIPQITVAETAERTQSEPEPNTSKARRK